MLLCVDIFLGGIGFLILQTVGRTWKFGERKGGREPLSAWGAVLGPEIFQPDTEALPFSFARGREDGPIAQQPPELLPSLLTPRGRTVSTFGGTCGVMRWGLRVLLWGPNGVT